MKYEQPVAQRPAQSLLQLPGHRYFRHQVEYALPLVEMLAGELDVDFSLTRRSDSVQEDGAPAAAEILFYLFQRKLLVRRELLFFFGGEVYPIDPSLFFTSSRLCGLLKLFYAIGLPGSFQTV